LQQFRKVLQKSQEKNRNNVDKSVNIFGKDTNFKKLCVALLIKAKFLQNFVNKNRNITI
jgi:hypothetical protein